MITPAHVLEVLDDEQALLELLADLDDDALVALVESVRARITENEAERDQLYAGRVAIFRAARLRTPPVTQRRLADAAGVSPVAVTQALRKAAS